MEYNYKIGQEIIFINMGLIIMKRKLLLLTLLSIFILGMILTPVTASHTIKVGKYKVKISDNKYAQLKKVYHGKAAVNFQSYHIKTKYHKKIKVPIYKNKKINKYKWKYTTILRSKAVYYNKNSNYTNYDYENTANKYKDWDMYGSYDINNDYNWGWISKHYWKLKKKVKYGTTTKKVKSGRYKTIKKPIYVAIIADSSAYAMATVYYTGTDNEDKYIGKEKKLKF